MRNDDFINLLRHIRLPLWHVLEDGSTYKIDKSDFPSIGYKSDFQGIEKMLVLSNGNGIIVGGVLFYGASDIQITIFPEFRGQGFMSAIHKNGILKSECFEGQEVSIAKEELKYLDDFLLRIHLLKMVNLKVKNLPEIYDWLYFFHQIDYDKDTFLLNFSEFY